MKKKYLILFIVLIFSGLGLLNSQTNELVADSLTSKENDKKSVLLDNVKYDASDSIIIDQKNNKITLYNNAKIEYEKTLQKKQKKIKKRNIYLIVSVSVIFLVIAAIDYYNKHNSLLILQSQQRQIANLEDQKRDLRQRELIAQKKQKEDSLAIENQRGEIEKRRLLLESKENTILKQEKQHR